MAITADEYQQLLVDEFQNAVVTSNIARYWALSGQASNALTYLKTRLYVIDLLLTGAAGQVDFRALNGASVNLSDYFDHVRALRDLAQAEWDLAISTAGDLAIGTIEKTAPIEPPTSLWPDGNDRRYRGDLYRRRIR